MIQVGSVSVFGVSYAVLTFDDYEAEGLGLTPDDEGQFQPVQSRILLREGCRPGAYEHEELHAIFDACGLTLLLHCEVTPHKRREELMVTMLTYALRSVVRDDALKGWLQT